MFITDHLPKLGPNLIPTLTPLNVKDFSHFGTKVCTSLGFLKWFLSGIWRGEGIEEEGVEESI
jgi:hypothetical protein